MPLAAPLAALWGDGVWRSLVARPLWERKAPGSNPGTPTRAVRRRPSPRPVTAGTSGRLLRPAAIFVPPTSTPIVRSTRPPPAPRLLGSVPSVRHVDLLDAHPRHDGSS